MKTKLLSIIFAVLFLSSCSSTLVLSDGNISKTIKIKKDITVVDGRINFTQKNGMKQSVPLELLVKEDTEVGKFIKQNKDISKPYIIATKTNKE